MIEEPKFALPTIEIGTAGKEPETGKLYPTPRVFMQISRNGVEGPAMHFEIDVIPKLCQVLQAQADKIRRGESHP